MMKTPSAATGGHVASGGILTASRMMDNASQDQTDDTPEPSPEVPPIATAFGDGGRYQQTRQQFIMGGNGINDTTLGAALSFNDHHEGDGNNDNPDDEDDSFHPSIRHVPSPLSPPPPSLCSGMGSAFAHGWNKQVTDFQRPPLNEVSLSRGGAVTASTRREAAETNRTRFGKKQLPNFGSYTSQTTSLDMPKAVAQAPSFTNQRQQQQQQQHRQHQDGGSLPAVVQLKQELVESQRSLLMLHQEHESLKREYERIVQDRISLNERVAAGQASEATVRTSLDQLSREMAQLQEETKSLKRELEAYEHMKADLAAATQEADFLKRRVNSLKAEKETLLRDITHQKQTIEDELESTKSRADRNDSENQRLKEKLKSLQGEVGNLTESDGASRRRIESLEAELKMKDASLQQVKARHQTEIEVLKAKLKEQETDDQKQSQANTRTIAELEREIARLDKAFKDATQKNNELRGEKLALRKEIARQSKRIQELEPKETAEFGCQTDEMDTSPIGCSAEIACQTDPPPTVEHVDCAIQTDPINLAAEEESTNGLNSVFVLPRTSRSGTASNNIDTITDRLSRIRDAAERAALSQEYRREVARLKAEHEADINKLEKEYETSIRKVMDEAKAENIAKNNALRLQLQSDYESKVRALQRKHQEELERTRDSSAAVANETVQAAVSEVKTTQEQLDREMSARKKLENEVQKLLQQLKMEEQTKIQIDKQRRQWEEQTNILLSSIRESGSAGSSTSSASNHYQPPQPAPISSSSRMYVTSSSGGGSSSRVPKSFFTVDTGIAQDSPLSQMGVDNATLTSTTRSTSTVAQQRSSPTSRTSPTSASTSAQYSNDNFADMANFGTINRNNRTSNSTRSGGPTMNHRSSSLNTFSEGLTRDLDETEALLLSLGLGDDP